MTGCLVLGPRKPDDAERAASPAMAAPKDTRPPTAPNNLHAVSITDQDIVLAWDRSTDPSGSVGYALFFDDNPTPFRVSGPQFDVHTNVVIGMIPGSTHTFQGRAEDSSGNASFSNKLSGARGLLLSQPVNVDVESAGWQPWGVVAPQPSCCAHLRFTEDDDTRRAPTSPRRCMHLPNHRFRAS